jgi:hypothetical protein
MKLEKVKQVVLEYIRENERVSYVEIENIFKKCGFDYEGNLDLVNANCNMVIFWGGWSADAFKMLSELKQAGAIYSSPTQLLTYLSYGKTLNYPLVRKDIQYKKPHWLPTVFRPQKA